MVVAGTWRLGFLALVMMAGARRPQDGLGSKAAAQKRPTRTTSGNEKDYGAQIKHMDETAAAWEGDEGAEEAVWMETAPWRIHKRAKTQHGGRGEAPTMSESLRIPPTRPPRVEQPAPARELDPMDAALEDEQELREQGEEDVPANPGREESHASWAPLLDVQDEDQVTQGMEHPSSSSSGPDMQLAPRHVERVTHIIHGMTTEGIIRMSINLPHVLHGVQAALGNIVQDQTIL